MPGYMCWRHLDQDRTSPKVLHLRYSFEEKWRPYTAFPLPILHDEPDHSQGWATYQMLSKASWILVMGG